MAIINFAKDLEPVIPKANEQFYMGTLTHTPRDVYHSIYAIVVNNNTGNIESTFRLECSLLVAGNAYYLYFRKAGEDLNASCPYIRTIKSTMERPSLLDWPFSNDNIGLYADAGLFRDKKIYFCTSALDSKIVKEKLNNKYNKPIKRTVISDTVYV